MHETYFSDQEWETTHEFQKIILSYWVTEDASRLEASRIMRKPIEIMKNKVDNLSRSLSDSSDLKYVLYSAHDD